MNTLLVVEDDPSIGKFVEINLRARSYHVVLAKTAEEALSFIQAHQPQLIILDRTLPDMNATEFMEQAAQSPNFASIPIILFTATTLVDTEKEHYFQHSQIVDILIKPVDVNILIDCVKKHLSASTA